MRTGRTCSSVVSFTSCICTIDRMSLPPSEPYEQLFWPAVLPGQGGQRVVHCGPTLPAHASLELALGPFPEGQCCDQGRASRRGKRQDAASISPLGSELYVTSLLQWLQIARQR